MSLQPELSAIAVRRYRASVGISPLARTTRELVGQRRGFVGMSLQASYISPSRLAIPSICRHLSAIPYGPRRRLVSAEDLSACRCSPSYQPWRSRDTEHLSAYKRGPAPATALVSQRRGFVGISLQASYISASRQAIPSI